MKSSDLNWPPGTNRATIFNGEIVFFTPNEKVYWEDKDIVFRDTLAEKQHLGTPTMVAEVTETEYQIARMLGDAWNLFCQLPKEHPMQDQEFCSAIHKCQDMVLSRAGIRAIKERDLQFCEERKNKE